MTTLILKVQFGLSMYLDLHKKGELELIPTHLHLESLKNQNPNGDGSVGPNIGLFGGRSNGSEREKRVLLEWTLLECER